MKCRIDGLINGSNQCRMFSCPVCTSDNELDTPCCGQCNDSKDCIGYCEYADMLKEI